LQARESRKQGVGFYSKSPMTFKKILKQPMKMNNCRADVEGVTLAQILIGKNFLPKCLNEGAIANRVSFWQVLQGKVKEA